MSSDIRQAVQAGSQAALSRFGVRAAAFNPHTPMLVARPGVMSTPSMRPASNAAPAPTAAPTGPSMLDRSLAMGSSIGRAAKRAIPSPGTLGLMGLGAVGASMLHAREPRDDGQLAYAPMPGSFIQ